MPVHGASGSVGKSARGRRRPYREPRRIGAGPSCSYQQQRQEAQRAVRHPSPPAPVAVLAVWRGLALLSLGLADALAEPVEPEELVARRKRAERRPACPSGRTDRMRAPLAV